MHCAINQDQKSCLSYLTMIAKSQLVAVDINVGYGQERASIKKEKSYNIGYKNNQFLVSQASQS